MRQDGLRRSIIAFAVSGALSGTAFAQATTTDAAIAELRRLIAEQRTALDRQAQIIDEQGRTLTALQQQVEAANARSQDRTGLTAPPAATVIADAQPPSPQPTARTASERAPDLPAAVVSAGDFPGSKFPLEWYVEKRICQHKKLLLAYMAENSTIESKQFFESLDAWQRCPSD